MAEYTVYAKLVVRFESDKTPAQIRAALVSTAPTLRQALKEAWRVQFQKDPTGGTVPVRWHFHAQGAAVDDSAELDLDDGLDADELE